MQLNQYWDVTTIKSVTVAIIVIVIVMIVLYCVKHAVVTAALSTHIRALNAVVTVAKIVGTLMHVAVTVVAATKLVRARSQNSRA